MLSKIALSRVPENVRAVASAIKQASGRAFLVGGPVRDLLLGTEPKDWDVATDLRPDEVIRIFPRATTVGIEFGRVQYSGVDVVSLRGESDYRDKRHPSSVTFEVPVQEDLRRRDFTVNAMAAEFDELSIIDPFGGMSDIERRLLRAVGDARERLAEDPLRMLRAVRFRTVLGFDLDEDVSRLLPGLAPLLEGVSGERVYAELARILAAGAVAQGIRDLDAWGLGRVVLPEVFGGADGTLGLPNHLAEALSFSQPDLPVRLALLFMVGDEATMLSRAQAALDRLGVPSEVRQAVFWLVRSAGESGFLRQSLASGDTDGAYLARRLLDEAGGLQVRRLADVLQAMWRASGKGGSSEESLVLAAGLRAVGLDDPGAEPCVPQLVISGEDVMRALGLQAGPLVGEALAHLKERVFRDPGLNRKDLLEANLREWWRGR